MSTDDPLDPRQNPERPANEEQRCPVCDYLASPDDAVCLMCGSSLAGSGSEAVEPESTAPSARPKPPGEDAARDTMPAGEALGRAPGAAAKQDEVAPSPERPAEEPNAGLATGPEAPPQTGPSASEATPELSPGDLPPPDLPDDATAPGRSHSPRPDTTFATSEPTRPPAASGASAAARMARPDPLDRATDAPATGSSRSAREPAAPPSSAAGQSPAGSPRVNVMVSVMRERQAPLTAVLAAAFFIVTALAAALVWPAARQSPMAVALFPTPTPIPPTLTFTPTVTPMPSETSPPTSTPSPTSIPTPSLTPQPPREHTVAANESLFSLGLRYNVGPESIAALNGLEAESFIQVDQRLLIPWPTPTPPLEPIVVELDGQQFLADPSDCQRYQIQASDSLVAIGQRLNVDYRAIQAVNRLSDRSFIQPGDTLCIPTLSFFDGELSPAAAGLPTPDRSGPAPGPRLLYPPDGTVFAAPDEPVVLQWVAVNDLGDDGWYMIELVNLTDLDSYPRRGFTRQTSFRVPSDWRPVELEPQAFRWNVRLVRVVAQRADGAFVREFDGWPSHDGFFTWHGAAPEPTPLPTGTATPAASS